MEEQLKEIVSLLEDIKFILCISSGILVGCITFFYQKIFHEKVDKKRK